MVFYEQAIDLLLEKHAIGDRIIYRLRKKTLHILQAIAWAIHTAEFYSSNSSKEIKRVQIEEIIKKELNCDSDETDLFYNEIILKSGILPLIDKGNEIHEFIHLSLQEYLVARKCKSDFNEIINELQKDNSHWYEISKLWCNISDYQITEFLNRLNSIDTTLTLECLAETQNKIDFETEKELISPHLKNIEKDIAFDTRVSKALGLIITTKSQNEKKGEFVFNFLVKQLEYTNKENKIEFICNALSISSIEESAKVLVKYYNKYSQAFEALTSMGELAVPFLEKIAMNNNIEALSCLKKIGTEESILSLQKFIWLEDNSDLCIHSSWLMSNLIKEKNVIDILNNTSINENHKRMNSESWIWRPFDDSANSPVFYISNRISYIILRSIKTNGIIIENEICQKIAIPITIKLKSIFNTDENKHEVLIDSRIRERFYTLYNTNAPPSKEMWLAISNAKGENNYYTFYKSVEFIGILFTIITLVILLAFFIFSYSEFGIASQSIFTILFILFVLLYGLKFNTRFLAKKKSILTDFGIQNPIIELPLYIALTIYLIMLSNSGLTHGLPHISLIGINLFFFIYNLFYSCINIL